MKLTKLEQETIILFNEEESIATIDTCNRALIRQMDDLSKKFIDVTCVSEDECGKCYTLPKKWIKVRKPKQYSEEQRSKLAEKAREHLIRPKEQVE